MKSMARKTSSVFPKTSISNKIEEDPETILCLEKYKTNFSKAASVFSSSKSIRTLNIEEPVKHEFPDISNYRTKDLVGKKFKRSATSGPTSSLKTQTTAKVKKINSSEKKQQSKGYKVKTKIIPKKLKI